MKQQRTMYGKMFRQYPDVISIQELQAMLGIGKNLAYKLVQDKAIHHIKAGRRYLIPKASVIDYLLAR